MRDIHSGISGSLIGDLGTLITVALDRFNKVVKTLFTVHKSFNVFDSISELLRVVDVIDPGIPKFFGRRKIQSGRYDLNHKGLNLFKDVFLFLEMSIDAGSADTRRFGEIGKGKTRDPLF